MTPDAVRNPIEESKTLPQLTAGMTTKVVKGSMWTLAGQIVPLAVTLVATPFTIRLLGPEGYGVLVLVGLIPTYLAFADFGMAMASTKYASEAHAMGNDAAEGRIVRTALLLGLLALVPIAIGIFVSASLVIARFNVPERYHSSAVLGLRIAAFTFVATYLYGVLNTPQLTRLRMDLNSVANSVPRVLGIIATPIVIYFGFGIEGVFLALFLCAVLSVISHTLISWKLLPELWGATLETKAIPRMLKYGGAFAVSSMAALMLGGVERLGLAWMSTVTELAQYSIALTVTTMLTLFSASMVQALIPAFSRLQSEETKDQLINLYSRGIRMSFALFLPVMVAVALVAGPFLTVWAGAELGPQAILPLHIMLVGLIFNVVAYFPVAGLIASGRTDLLARIYWIELVPYAVLAFFLIGQFGAVGAAIAWSIRITVDAIMLFVIARRSLGLSVRHHAPAMHFLSAAVLLIPFAMVFVAGKVHWVVLSVAAACLAMYCVLGWRHLLDKDERSWIRSKIYGEV